jgi:EmrB/QacA subfamily drug resistance transporter
MTTTSLDAESSPLKARNMRVVLAGLMTVMALAVIDSNIVNTSLPRIASELGGMSQLSWVLTAFLLTTTIAAPLYGKLSDLYGRRRLLIIAIGVFLAGSVLCGLAQSMLSLILFRGLQGIGAGGLVTMVQAIVGDLVPPKDRSRYQSLLTVVFAVSSLAGPLIGGALTTYLSWRWIFYVNVPLGALALALILSSLPRIQHGRRHSIDYLGIVLLTVSTTSILMVFSSGLSAQGATTGAVLAAVAALATGLFVWQERRAPEPILPLSLFANRTFTLGVSATATMSFAILAVLLLLPLYLQLVMGQTPMQAAMVVTPQILGMVVSSLMASRMKAVSGQASLLLALGVALQAVGLWSLVVQTELGSPVWTYSVSPFLLGMGMGLGMPNVITIVQNAVGREQLGTATGSISFFRSLGGAAGIALSGGVITFVLRASLAREHFGPSLDAAIDQGVKVLAQMTPPQHARYVAAYRSAIEVSLVICALAISATLPFVLLLWKKPPPVAEVSAQPS